MASEKHEPSSTELSTETLKEVSDSSTTTARASSPVLQPALQNTLLNTEPLPPRPMSPQQQAQATLQEAFPSIDPAVVRAVLVASSGQIEPAFTALLSMSDPSVAEEEMRPIQPPRPRPRVQSPQRDLDYNPAQTYTERPQRLQGPGGSYTTSTPQNQLEADEMYARQLAEHFETNSNRRTVRGSGGSTHFNARGAEARGNLQQPPRLSPRDDDYDSDKEHSFLDDDLPVIKENIRKGFVETQNKFNSWITDIKKRLDGDSPENSPPSSARNSGQYTRPTVRPIDEPGKRGSRDGGYDADPRVLSDDFTHLHLRDNTIDAPQPRRPKANPDLFQRSTAIKAGRKVSFEDRPTNISDEDLYRPAPGARSAVTVLPARQPSPATASKWEPLKSVEPAPMDRDPFSLGDSDDEREVSTKEVEPTKQAPTPTPTPNPGTLEIGVTTSKDVK